MKRSALLIAGLLLTASVGAQAGEAPAPALENLKAAGSPPCKTLGDGTFAEIVTTIASALPKEQGDALLAQYCEPCMLKRFALAAQVR